MREQNWLVPEGIKVWTTPHGACFHQIYCQFVDPNRAEESNLAEIMAAGTHTPCPRCTSEALQIYIDEIIANDEVSTTPEPSAPTTITVDSEVVKAFLQLVNLLVPIIEDNKFSRNELKQVHHWLSQNRERCALDPTLKSFYAMWGTVFNHDPIPREMLDQMIQACRLIIHAGTYYAKLLRANNVILE